MKTFEIERLAKRYIQEECDNSADDTLGRMKRDARIKATQDFHDVLKAIDAYQPKERE